MNLLVLVVRVEMKRLRVKGVETRPVSVEVDPFEVLEKMCSDWKRQHNVSNYHLTSNNMWAEWDDNRHGSDSLTEIRPATPHEIEIMTAFSALGKLNGEY